MLNLKEMKKGKGFNRFEDVKIGEAVRVSDVNGNFYNGVKVTGASMKNCIGVNIRVRKSAMGWFLC